MFIAQHTNLPKKRAAQKEQQMKDALLDATNAATAVTAAKGKAVSVSYDWAARPNYIEDLSCFFNE